MEKPRGDDLGFELGLFMDCVHVRERTAAPTAYVMLDRERRLGRMVGCRMCEPCRQHIENVLQLAPILGSPDGRAP